ncbi:MAG TPA: hypothetical protein VF039_14530 [Longimicrobiales bacterium]
MKKHISHATFAIALAALTAVGPRSAAAQTSASDTTCTYDACALRIESTFFGGQYLARGQAGVRVAPIAPFSSAITRALANGDSASIYAATFDTKYRWGTSMALAGSVIGTIPFLLDGDDFSDVDIAFTITGYGIALVGGWLVNSAFRDLHRAVWWHNREFAE